ncbi:MAG: hypothetical protein KC462_08660, partial [Cyanobacteria bacterium HKST-UBA05]|nr:hypothetical protein [Cyanobacteria bacterium HKST-UBA05]
MKITYFSSGPRQQLFEALLASKHDVVRVVTTDPERWPKVEPTLALAKAHGIPVVKIKHKDELDRLVPLLEGTVCLSAGFAFLFPASFLTLIEQQHLMLLNVHGTLLPKYRGGRTLNWVIAHGETESGVTVHQIDTGMDTGPILLQRRFPVSAFDTGKSLYRKTLAFEPEVVLEALALLEVGKAEFTPQPRLNGHKHPGLEVPDRQPEHSELDASQPLCDLYDTIRAADPVDYPAHFFVEGQKVCVKLWRDDKPAD